MWEIRLKIANFGSFQEASFARDLRDPKSTSGGVYCAYLDHIRFVPCFGCAESKSQILTAVPSLIFFCQTQVYVWMDYQLFNFGIVSWKRYPVSQLRGNFSVTHAKESFRLTHILTLCVLSLLTTLHPTFPTVHCQHNSTCSKTMRQWFKWSTKDEVQTLGTSQERTEGIFTTMQLNSMLTFWQIRRPCESNDVRTFFFRKTFLMLSFRKAPCNVSVEDTHQKYWKQVALWMVTLPWNNWVIVRFIVTKTRGIFLQGCSISRKRRETSCKLMHHLGSWESKKFVR